jgi:aminoglycoside 2''-phosphotransferase
MSTDCREAIASIERATGLPVRTHKVIDHGAAHLVIEVDDEWIFRFPRGGASSEESPKRWRFLTTFATQSPVAVPEPVYVTDQFIGYRKIAGSPLHPAHIERLDAGDRQRIAKQLGLFLSALHRCRDERIDFDAGLLVMRHGYDRTCPEPLTSYLDVGERRKLDARLAAIAGNPANFVEPTSIIHADLYFGNILWDRKSKCITGIIDWSEMGLGIPAMDFLGLADFTTSRNDDFLRSILAWYGGDEALFRQVKENVVIEVLNWLWFYRMREDPAGVRTTVRRLRHMLNA